MDIAVKENVDNVGRVACILHARRNVTVPFSVGIFVLKTVPITAPHVIRSVHFLAQMLLVGINVVTHARNVPMHVNGNVGIIDVRSFVARYVTAHHVMNPALSDCTVATNVWGFVVKSVQRSAVLATKKTSINMCP